jgi:hypothetical protein
MPSFDLANSINAQIAVSTRLLTATNVNSSAIDTAGYEGVAFVTQTGVNINGTVAVNIVEIRVGSDTNVTNSAIINANYVTKSPVAITANNAANWSGIGILGGSESTRYVFVTVNAGASNTNGSVTAILGFPHTIPTT